MIALCYVHPGWVPTEFMDSVTHLLEVRKDVVRLRVRSGPMISGKRNVLVELVVRSMPEVEHVLFVDTDSVFDPKFVELLVKRNVPIVSALYYGQHESGETFPVGNAWDPEGNLRQLDPRDVKHRGLVTVAGVGMGFTLIRRDVLETLGVGEPLWPFAERVVKGQPIGEDVSFCLRAKEAGFESYIDTTVRVGHVKGRVVWGR